MKKRQSSRLTFIITSIFLLIALCFAVILTVKRISEPPKETLLVGVNTPFPPFEYRVGDQIVGFDIDMAERIAKALGRKLVIQDFQDFDALLPALVAGKLDMVASAVTIRPDRDEVVDFSIPYFIVSQGVLTKKDSKYQLISEPAHFQDLMIGCQEGTTSQFWVEENLLNKISIKGMQLFGDLAMAIQLLRLGKIDVILLDKPAADYFVKINQDLKVVGEIKTGEEYGFVVQEGDPQKILPKINYLIKKMQETGEYRQLLEKWFGEVK